MELLSVRMMRSALPFWGGVGTGGAEVSALSSEEFGGGSVDEFSPVVSLKTFYGRAELCFGERSKLN